MLSYEHFRPSPLTPYLLRMKIYTKTGDDGTTGLGDGSRTTKDSLRIDAMGEVDELNSSLGVLLCEELPDSVRAALKWPGPML